MFGSLYLLTVVFASAIGMVPAKFDRGNLMPEQSMNLRCAAGVRRFLGGAALVAIALLGTTTLPIMVEGKGRRSTYTVPAATSIRLRLNQQLSSKSARVGDTFTSTVVDPVYVRGVEVIPAGSTVTGKVTEVTKAARKGREGSISVAFTSIDTPKPNHYTINGSLASADGEGVVKGASSKKQKAQFVGRGVVVGGLMNGAAGVVRGATIGVARGLIKKGNEAQIKPGTEFNVVLNKSVSTYAFR